MNAGTFPPRIAKVALQLKDSPHRKSFGATFMDGEERADISMEWDHELCPFAERPPCLVVCEATGTAWKRDEETSWMTLIVFEETKASWQAAWRIARLLVHALPNRPAIIAETDMQAIVAILPGAKCRCAFRLEGTL